MQHHAEDTWLTLAPLVPEPASWLANIPPNSLPILDATDPAKVKGVLETLLNQSLTHYQLGALTCQDVNIARVSSWVTAESFKGTPGIFDRNDEELTKKLKETIMQNDSLLKLGLMGAGRGGGGRGGSGGGQGSGKGGKGKQAKGKGKKEKRCFHCRSTVYFSPVSFSGSSPDWLFQAHLRPQCPSYNGTGGGGGGKSGKKGGAGGAAPASKKD